MAGLDRRLGGWKQHPAGWLRGAGEVGMATSGGARVGDYLLPGLEPPTQVAWASRLDIRTRLKPIAVNVAQSWFLAWPM